MHSEPAPFPEVHLPNASEADLEAAAYVKRLIQQQDEEDAHIASQKFGMAMAMYRLGKPIARKTKTARKAKTYAKRARANARQSAPRVSLRESVQTGVQPQ